MYKAATSWIICAALAVGIVPSGLSAADQDHQALGDAEQTLDSVIEQKGALHPDVAAARMELAKLLFGLNDLEAARQHLSQASEILLSSPDADPRQTGTSLNNLAYVLAAQQGHDDAVAAYLRATEHYRSQGLGSESVLGTAHENLAESLAELGRQDEAAHHLRAALEIFEIDPETNAGQIDDAAGRLAAIYRDQQDEEKAEAAYRKIIAARKVLFGDSHHQVVAIMTDLARMLEGQARYREAEDLHREGLALYRESLGEDHYAVGWKHLDLGRLYRSQGRGQEAALELERAKPLQDAYVTAEESRLGADSLAFAEVLVEVGRNHRLDIGDHESARSYLARALAILETIHGPEDGRLLDVVNQLAWSAEAQERFAEAQPYYRRAPQLTEKLVSRDDPRLIPALKGLAYATNEIGRHQEADRHLERALQISRAGAGPDSIDLAERYNDLAILALRRRDHQLAEARSLKALEIYRREGGPGHPGAGAQLRFLARITKLSGELDQAIDYALEVLQIADGKTDLNDSAVKSVVADTYLHEPRPAKAEQLFDALARRIGRRFDSVAQRRSFLLSELGAIYRQNKRSADTEIAYRRSIDVYREAGGGDPDWIAPRLYELAFIARQDGRVDEALELAEKAVALLSSAQSPNFHLLANGESFLGVTLMDRGDHEQSVLRLTRALDHSRDVAPPDPRLVAKALYNLAGAQSRGGEPQAALTTLESALTRIEQAHGTDDTDYEFYLGYRGVLQFEIGDLESATESLERAIGLAERNKRAGTLRESAYLVDLGTVLTSLGRLEESVAAFVRGLQIRERVLGPDHLLVADAHVWLGDALAPLGQFDRAIASYKRALEIRKSNDDTEDHLVVWAMQRLAKIQGDIGKVDDAEALFEEALAIWEGYDRAVENGLGQTLRAYGSLLQTLGRYSESEPLLKRALAIEEEAFGKTSPRLVDSLSRLVQLYSETGRSFDAAENQLRAIGILEMQNDADPIDLAGGLIRLAFIKVAWEEQSEAIDILERSQGLLDRVEHQKRLQFARMLMQQGDGYVRTKQFDKAETALVEAGRILREVSGDASFDLRILKLHLANSKIQQKEFEQGLILIEETFEEIKTLLGPDSPITSTILEVAPALYLLAGRHEDALAMFDEALGGERSNLLQGHPMEAFILVFRGLVELERGRFENGLDLVGKASTMELRNIRRAAEDRGGAGGRRTYDFGLALALHIALLDRKARAQPGQRESLLALAFELAQEGQGGSAAGALARMAARFSAGSNRLGQVVRARQDKLEAWTKSSRFLSGATALALDQRDTSSESAMRERMALLDTEIRQLDQLIGREFPDYADLIRPGAVSLSDIQGLLQPDEGLLFFDVGRTAESPALEQYLQQFLPGRTALWVVRHDKVELQWVDLDHQALEEAAARIRRTLDPTGLRIERLEDVPQFDRGSAYDLYLKLFAPAEALLRGVRNVFIVPSGPLQSLPLSVLITEPPTGQIDDLQGYRDLPWLARDYAMTTLPSVASLRSLRHFAKSSATRNPFTGFGNPVLNGEAGKGRGINLATFFRGAVANVNAVRDLPALPDSEQELNSMADALYAEADNIFLGEAATETQVKTMDLSNSRILAFATHGLVAGEQEGNVEPALVLTPPETGTALDDGLLTASEIAQLELNADWVILSACNTASGSKPGTEGLSGLARAFFYAGSRALLVSHWPVVSDTAVKLTTNMLAHAKKSSLTRAEALRRSLLALMKDPDHPYYAHPMFWAPFTVVGEGGQLDRQ